LSRTNPGTGWTAFIPAFIRLYPDDHHFLIVQ
jgi:hypothetical protein